MRAGDYVPVWLHFLNGGPLPQSVTVPPQVEARLTSGGECQETLLELADPGIAGVVSIPPGGFVRREYRLKVPPALRGTVILELQAAQAGRLALDVIEPALKDAASSGGKAKPTFAQLIQEAEPRAEETGAMRFFKEHFFGYEPFYFIAGTESPNAKFQISLRYQLLNEQGPLARKVPPLKGLNLAYTQTSLWDWNAASAPFFDSSYKPELLYLWQRVDRHRWADWIRLDLQGGFQHESNGKGDLDSRSLNIAYLRPTLTLGREDRLQLSLSPRVWCYVGGLDDNPDLPDYRGYFDVRAVLGWQRGVQLSAYGRIGDDFDHGSLQLDLTYPMMRLLSGSFSLYLQAQYFTGYGESLLLYQDRSDAFRIGFALFR